MAGQNGFVMPPGATAVDAGPAGPTSSGGFVMPPGATATDASANTTTGLDHSTGSSYQADASSDLPQREAAHPVLTGVGKGAGDLLSPLWNIVAHPVDTVTNMVKSSPIAGAYDAIKNSAGMLNAYENARSSGANITDSLHAAADHMQKQDAARQMLDQRVAEYKKNPTAETIRALTDVAGTAALIYAGGGGGVGADTMGAEDAARAAGIPEETEAATSTRAQDVTPSLKQNVLKGANAAEPQARAALQRGVHGAGLEAGVEPVAGTIPSGWVRASLDDHLEQLQTNESAAYEQMDDAAGFDVKSLKDKMGKDQYNLNQLGNTEEDVAKAHTLQKSIGDAQERIVEAEQKMTDAGVDPKAADALHTKRMAAEEFRDKILHNQNVVRGNAAHGGPSNEETVDIDNLTKESQKMMDRDKFGGSRLEQFMGKQGAEEYMTKLRTYQSQGVHALKQQAFAKMVAKYAVLPVTGYEAVKHLLP